MFIKTLSIATAAVIVAGVGLKTAEAKDLNGASSYVGVSTSVLILMILATTIVDMIATLAGPKTK